MVLWQIHTERLSCPSSSCPLPRIQVPPEAAEHMLLQKGLNVGFPRKHTMWLTPQARSSETHLRSRVSPWLEDRGAVKPFGFSQLLRDQAQPARRVS